MPINMTIFNLRILKIDDVKVINCICIFTNLIFEPESNKYHTKTINQNKQSLAKTMKSQKNKRKKTGTIQKLLIELKKKKEKQEG